MAENHLSWTRLDDRAKLPKPGHSKLYFNDNFKKVKQKMPTGGYFLLDAAKTFAAQEKSGLGFGSSHKNIDTRHLIEYYLRINMPTLTGSGISTKLDSFIAGKDAASNAFSQISRRSPNIIIAFISTIFDQQEAIKGIRSIIKEAPLMGCSSAGVISPSGSFRNAVGVFLIHSDSLSFSYGIGNNAAKNPRFSGKKAATEASESASIKKRSYIMFSDSLSSNSAEIMRGSQEILGTSFPIIGGGATDDFLFQKTYQYVNNNVYSDSVVGLMIGGDVNTGIARLSGWQPIGKPHKITSAKSNIIRQIDKRVAIEIYEEYFEKPFEELKKDGIIRLGVSYPIGMQRVDKKDYTIRIPLKIEDDGSIVLSAELPEGEEISLMIGDKNLILESTKETCLEAIKDIKIEGLKFALIFSDIARLQLLRKDSYKEVEIINNILGKNIPFFGCYTYGEYASSHKDDVKLDLNFNNHSIAIAVFSE